ncbi:MAG: DNA repair protein RadA [Gammaproteobacteria bacterium]
MAKPTSLYVCNECGAQTPKWAGQCPACGAWNALLETAARTVPSGRGMRVVAGGAVAPRGLDEVAPENIARLSTGLGELDRVLGGGLVAGSVVLLGGDPGVGKSTLLIQALAALSRAARTLYVSGEESADQVALRAQRLGVGADTLKGVRLYTETQVEAILGAARAEQPQVMVLDSIQTLYSEVLQSAPGSVAQVRESAAQLVRYAKQSGTALFLVGHVTKEGTLAGPRVLEHMVDAVLYFEGDTGGSFRIIRAVKNRFGAVNEIGVFVMTDAGLREVGNPSAMFLSRQGDDVAGSAVLATQEGTRPLLVEVQALVDQSHLANPRRVCVGLDSTRLAMLLAVLHRHAGVATYDQDVFVNVVGGVRVLEPAADLAVIAAIWSSLRNKPLGRDLVIFGEIGLAGEVRPVARGLERIREAAKLGFRRALVPAANMPKKGAKGELDLLPVKRLGEALELLRAAE